MTRAALNETPVPLAANDNHKPDGRHDWPAFDRLKAGTMMRSSEANATGLAALLRFRRDVDLISGADQEQWVTFGDSAAVNEDVRHGYGADLVVERVTAEHLIALELAGELEYRPAPDGQVLPHKRDGEKAYQLEDRLRGERGPARAQHPAEVEDELNGRYDAAAWPSAPGAATSARHMFLGASIRCKPSPRTWRTNDTHAVEKMLARRTDAFVRGALPAAVRRILHEMADGATSVEIGERRGHRDRYASAVGTELQRLAIDALAEAYADFDGCHSESAS